MRRIRLVFRRLLCLKGLKMRREIEGCSND
jgi:hypothetical protein